MSILEVAEGKKYQGVDEEIIYKITTTNWGSNPTDVSVKAYIGTNNQTDVTSSVFPTNSPTVSGDEITLSPLKNLDHLHEFRIEVKFTVNSNIMECFFIVHPLA